MSIENLAARYYENARVVRLYGDRSELLPPEEKLIQVYAADIAGARILDLGCGGGRTTARLHALASEYVGLDYSSTMIERCKQRYPGVRFVHGDATDLARFGETCFDFALFSYNGIDTMSQATRLRVLHEVYRVLAPGGLFAFSSHNIECRDSEPRFDRSALLSPRALLREARHLVSYLRVKHEQIETRTYSILSDARAGYKQLTYYINKANQVAQLDQIGFVDPSVLSERGELVAAAAIDRESKWLYYVCRKPRDGEPSAAPTSRP